MPATASRTVASSSAGNACRSAEAANRVASSSRPAAKRATARVATRGPRSACRGGRQFERSPGELGGSGRIARTEISRRLEHDGDGGFVARLGAVGELLRHLDGKRAFSQEDVGRLTVERPANRGGGAGPHCLADQVVRECQPVAALNEDASLDKILIGSSSSGIGIRAS